MVYKWRDGSRIGANAQIAGEMCAQLESEGRLTAKNLLDANRPEDAPLHGVFDWNDSTAAESWRTHQARNVINSLVVVAEQAEPVRGFFKIERSESTYHSLSTIIRSESKTEALLREALGELEAFKRKYNTLKQLTDVFCAIEKVQKERM